MELRLNAPEGFPQLVVQYNDTRILSLCFSYSYEGLVELSWTPERGLEVNRWTPRQGTIPAKSVRIDGGHLPSIRDVEAIMGASDGSAVADMAIDLLKKVVKHPTSR